MEDIEDVLRQAITEMESGRPGPVFVEFPTNVLHEEVASAGPAPVMAPEPLQGEETLDTWDFDALLDDLSKARYPLLLIGAGVRTAKARDAALEFAETTGIPFVTTTLAKGTLPEGHPQSLGSCGIWGQPAAREYILEHTDAIMALGTTFQELSSYGWRIKPDNVLLRVDIDVDELSRNYAGRHRFCGNLRPFMAALDRAARQRSNDFSFSEAQERVRALKDDVGYYTTIPHKHEADTESAVNPVALVKAISDLTPPEVTVVSDVGENGAWSMYLIERSVPGSYVINAGLGSMGHSAAAAVGVSLGRPGKKVVSICGDGGLMMNGNEIATAVRDGASVLWVVFNNGILGTQKHYQRDYLDGRYIACEMPDVDYCAYARSMGAEAARVTAIDDFRKVFAQMLTAPGNALIEVVVDPEVKPEPCYFY